MFCRLRLLLSMSVLLAVSYGAAADRASAIPYIFLATGNKCQLDTEVTSRKGDIFAGVRFYNITHSANVGCQFPSTTRLSRARCSTARVW